MKKPLQWYLKAGELGERRAMLNLGVMYDEGQGVAQSDAEAFKWYLKASELGEGEATKKLVSMYNNTRLTTQQHQKTAQLFRQTNQDVTPHDNDIYSQFHQARLQEDEKKYLTLLSPYPYLFKEIIGFEGTFFLKEAIALLEKKIQSDDIFFTTKLHDWINTLVDTIHGQPYPKEMAQDIHRLMLKCLQLLTIRTIRRLEPVTYFSLIEELYLSVDPLTGDYSYLLQELATHTTQLLGLLNPELESVDNINLALLATILIKQDPLLKAV